jgi:hypothetical protein
MPEHKHLAGDARRVAWNRGTLGEVVNEVLELVATRELEEEPTCTAGSRRGSSEAAEAGPVE